MKSNEQLINNIIGQLEGVKKMMDCEKDCTATITQLKAAKSALNTVIRRHIETHLKHCVDSCGEKDVNCHKIISELLKH